VEFRITRHSGATLSAPPADALDSLWQRLGAKRDEVSFARVGDEIRATASEDLPVSMPWDERAEIRRRVVLDIVRGVCEQAAELEWDWFAVSSGK
jgi:hypothetical protein